MPSNPNISSSFLPHKTPFPITITNRSTYNIVSSDTIKPISSINLSSVLNLLKFTFNMISRSKLTKNLNCRITLFPNNCALQDFRRNRLLINDMYQMISIFLILECLDRLPAIVSFLRLKHIVNWDIFLFLY